MVYTTSIRRGLGGGGGGSYIRTGVSRERNYIRRKKRPSFRQKSGKSGKTTTVVVNHLDEVAFAPSCTSPWAQKMSRGRHPEYGVLWQEAPVNPGKVSTWQRAVQAYIRGKRNDYWGASLEKAREVPVKLP